MYYYFYDAFLNNNNRWQKQLYKIENRTVDLGINGKIGRGSILLNPEKLIQEEIANGATTIVAVGNDQTVSKILKGIAGSKATLGIIPLGKNNKIAEILGIPEGVEACNVLSQRRLQKIDLMEANGQFFLSQIKMELKKPRISCEGKYEIKILTQQNKITAYNLANKKALQKQLPLAKEDKNYFSPFDGFLDLVIEPQPLPRWQKMFSWGKTPTLSLIPAKKVTIDVPEKERKNFFAWGDEQIKLTFPLEISIRPKQLKVITGRNRQF